MNNINNGKRIIGLLIVIFLAIITILLLHMYQLSQRHITSVDPGKYRLTISIKDKRQFPLIKVQVYKGYWGDTGQVAEANGRLVNIPLVAEKSVVTPGSTSVELPNGKYFVWINSSYGEFSYLPQDVLLNHDYTVTLY